MAYDPLPDLRHMCHAAACLVAQPIARQKIVSGEWDQVQLSERLHGWFCTYSHATLAVIAEEERAALRAASAKICTVIVHIVANPKHAEIIGSIVDSELGERLNTAIAAKITEAKAETGT